MSINNRGKDKHGKTIYRIEVYNGTDPITGKARRESDTIHGTRTEAKRREAELLQQLKNGLDIRGGEQLFSEFAADYLKIRAKSDDITRRTKESEKFIVNKLSEVFGSYRLCDITTQAIDKGLEKIRHSRRNGSTPLSGTSMDKYFKTMNLLMERALNYDLIQKNPCRLARKFKKDTKKRTVLSVEKTTELRNKLESDIEAEIVKLAEKESRLRACCHDKNRGAIRGLNYLSCLVGVFLIIRTGLRHGEALGLQWSDFTEDGQGFKVSRTTEYDGAYKAAKSEAGERMLYLNEEDALVVIQWKNVQRTYLEKLGIKQKPGDRSINSQGTTVMCSDTGGKMDYYNFSRFWRSYRKGFRIGEGFGLHDLRHTFLTHLYGSGVDLKTLQTIAGHSAFSLTMNIYVHHDESKSKEAFHRVSALYSEHVKQTPVIKFPSLETG